MASTVGLYAEMYADCGLVVDEVNRSAPTVEELKEVSANTPDQAEPRLLDFLKRRREKEVLKLGGSEELQT